MPDTAIHATRPIAPLDIAACVRERLAARDLGLRIYGALDLAAGKSKLRTPCVVVVPMADTRVEVASPDVDVEVVQRMRTTVAAVVGVGAANDLGGTKGRAADDLIAKLALVRESLLGWPPGGPFPIHPPTDPPHSPASPASEWPLQQGRPTPLLWDRGRLLTLEDGRAWWQDEYSTTWLVSGAERTDPDGRFSNVRAVCYTMATPVGADPEGPFPLEAAP